MTEPIQEQTNAKTVVFYFERIRFTFRRFRNDPQPATLRPRLLLLQTFPVSAAVADAQKADFGLRRAPKTMLQTKVRRNRQGHAYVGHPKEREPSRPTGGLSARRLDETTGLSPQGSRSGIGFVC